MGPSFEANLLSQKVIIVGLLKKHQLFSDRILELGNHAALRVSYEASFESTRFHFYLKNRSLNIP